MTIFLTNIQCIRDHIDLRLFFEPLIYMYVTIIFDVFFMSWDDLVTLFLQIPAKAAPATWRWLLRCWRWFLRYSCKSYHLPGMLRASAAQVCQRVSIVWLSLLFLFAQVDACFCFV